MCHVRHEYRDEIIDILSQRGRKGHAVAVIALIVFNNHNDLFSPAQSYEELRAKLQRYLWTQSRRRGSPFTRVRHGVYALKRSRGRQLVLAI